MPVPKKTERNAELIRLAQSQQFTDKQLAEKFGVCASRAAEIRRAAGISPVKPEPKPTAAQQP